jgi:hypothetical protein
MGRFHRIFSVAALALPLVSACVAHTDNLTFHRTQAPALPEGCPVNRIASDAVPYPVEDLVTITVRYLPGGRDRTMAKLETDACYYGGDTIYKIKEESLNNVATQVTATIARRPPGSTPPAASTTAPAATAPPPAAPAGSAPPAK